MAIILNNLYNDIRGRYSLKLIAGENGLFKAVHWLYFTEDIYNIDFLRGGELVITTGLGYTGENWIIELIQRLIESKASGLIINTGKYITPLEITPKIKEFCNKYSIPLFIMPWHIHISDITEDIYNRFFYENKKSDKISDTILNIINGISSDISMYKELSFLDRNYILLYISAQNDIVNDRLIHITIENYVNNNNINCRLIYDNAYILISEETDYKNFGEYILYYIPNAIVGVSSVQKGANNLPIALNQGKNALIYGKSINKNITHFNDTGIYQIFFSTTSDTVLKNYYYTLLKTIIDYDTLHNSELEYTLQKYIESDCSIIKTAEITNCHRNTINYRIKKIKELFNSELDNSEIKYKLYTAFKIKDFLKLKEIYNERDTNN